MLLKCRPLIKFITGRLVQAIWGANSNIEGGAAKNAVLRGVVKSIYRRGAEKTI